MKLIYHLLHSVFLLACLFTPMTVYSQKTSVDIEALAGKWANLMSRNDYPDGSYESGVTGDYEPVKLYSDTTWSYYSKRGKMRFEPFTKEDSRLFNIESGKEPPFKVILEDFSNGNGVGYFTFNEATGIPERLIIRFNIYYPKEGYATWTQYKKD